MDGQVTSQRDWRSITHYCSENKCGKVLMRVRSSLACSPDYFNVLPVVIISDSMLKSLSRPGVSVVTRGGLSVKDAHQVAMQMVPSDFIGHLVIHAGTCDISSKDRKTVAKSDHVLIYTINEGWHPILSLQNLLFVFLSF